MDLIIRIAIFVSGMAAVAWAYVAIEESIRDFKD